MGGCWGSPFRDALFNLVNIHIERKLQSNFHQNRWVVFLKGTWLKPSETRNSVRAKKLLTQTSPVQNYWTRCI